MKKYVYGVVVEYKNRKGKNKQKRREKRKKLHFPELRLKKDIKYVTVSGKRIADKEMGVK